MVSLLLVIDNSQAVNILDVCIGLTLLSTKFSKRDLDLVEML